MTYYPPERNIGGYATRNDEIVLQPSQPIQVDPRSIDIQGTRYRPVVISNEPVAPREWSSIEGSLRERIGG